MTSTLHRTMPAAPPDPAQKMTRSAPQALADAGLLFRVLAGSDSARPETAADLIDRFGSLGAVLGADSCELRRAGAEEGCLEFIGCLRETVVRAARDEACRRPVISSWSQLLAYVRTAVAHLPREQFRALFLDKRNVLIREEAVADGQHNTILDNCAVYTAFSALDPLTQDKVSKLTGTVLETRVSRSSPSGLGQGRSSVSRSTSERPLLEPGEIRALPDDQQLVFVAGQRPLRTRKLRYDRCKPYRLRADLPPPDQAARLDGPPSKPHLWAGRRSAGQDADAELPLFKEVRAAMDDKKFTARLKVVMGKVATELVAQDEVLDHLMGEHNDKG